MTPDRKRSVIENQILTSPEACEKELEELTRLFGPQLREYIHQATGGVRQIEISVGHNPRTETLRLAVIGRRRLQITFDRFTRFQEDSLGLTATTYHSANCVRQIMEVNWLFEKDGTLSGISAQTSVRDREGFSRLYLPALTYTSPLNERRQYAIKSR